MDTINDSHQSLGICSFVQMDLPSFVNSDANIVVDEGRRQPVWSSCLIDFQTTYLSDNLHFGSLQSISGRSTATMGNYTVL